MSIFRKKLISVLLAISMVGAFSAVTVYADELDSTITDNDYTTDDGNTGEIPPVEPPAIDDTPSEDIIPDDSNSDSYDDSGNSSSTNIQDNNNFDDSDNIDYGTSDDQYVYDDTYSSDYSDQSYQNYDSGMSFDEFERATDYSATIDTESPTVDMYNSNGSDNDTLSSSDWNDIRLNLGESPAGGVGDFSFIKDNNSDENSNFSILFLIFGIIFVVASIILIIYLISSSVKSKKLAKADVYTRDKKRTSSRDNNRTRFNYDTSEIDISNYNDNF